MNPRVYPVRVANPRGSQIERTRERPATSFCRRQGPGSRLRFSLWRLLAGGLGAHAETCAP